MDRNRAHRRTCLLLAGWAAVCQAACSPSESAKTRPNVLLITVDTLRADRLGCYGSTSASTPAIDRLAREGTLFVNAAAPMPSTRPSHASILTSLYPRDHGVLSNAETLAEEITTLPELFAAAGYLTAAFTGVKLLARGSGMEKGFATFEAPEKGEHRIAGEVVAQAQRWLRSERGGRPFFLWLHVYDPHMPYAPPTPSVTAPPELPADAAGFSRPPLRPLLERTGGDLPRSLLEYALAMYGAEVEYVDRQLAGLLATLREQDAMENTVLVFTADHGECFENGFYFEHGECLFEGAIRIPLLLRYPPAVTAGKRMEGQVELLDIAPTLLELAGLPAAPGFAGRSLLAPGDPTARVAFLQRPVYSPRAIERRQRREYLRSIAGEPLEASRNGRMAGLRTPSWKYITGDGSEWLYDLRTDPGERINLAGERPGLARKLRQHLELWMEEHPIPLRAPSDPDAELEKTLKALGYL